MIPDPTHEIKEIRRKLAAKFDNDVRRIGDDIRQQERQSGRTFISLPKREPVGVHVTRYERQSSSVQDVRGKEESTTAR